MPNATALEAKPIKLLIADACAQRTAAELHYTDRDDRVITARVLILDQTATEILADRPQYADADGKIPVGQELTVHLSLNGERVQFHSMILNDRRVVRSAGADTQLGVALRMPRELTPSQRRLRLRVSMTTYDPIVVDLAVPHAETPDACDFAARFVRGWLRDLSVGGTAIVSEVRGLRNTRRGDRFFMTFSLPGVRGDFNWLASVRHVRTVGSESVRVALAFCPWNGNQFNRDRHRVSRFIADHERRMIRRRR